jgi:hypothetical protein
MDHLGSGLSILIAIVVVLFFVWPSIWSRYEEWRERRQIDARGGVLAGAEVTVASLEPTPPVDDPDDPLPRAFYSIDLTIAPRPGPKGETFLWEPLLLDIVDPEEAVDTESDAGADLCKLYTIEVWELGRFISEDEIDDRETAFEIEGPGRLRLLVGAHESARRFSLLYYATEFGDVRLPRPE